MSEGTKRPYAQMHGIACGLVERLRPACQRIEIAGSIRRKRPTIGDIELIAIPTPITDLFGVDSGTTLVDATLAAWPITFIKNGQKYKQFTFEGRSGETYTVDLFLQPDPATFGINYMIRTGSAAFSKRMVTKRSQGGYMPDDLRVDGAKVWRNGAIVPTLEEMDVFDLWQMDFVEPEERN